LATFAPSHVVVDLVGDGDGDEEHLRATSARGGPWLLGEGGSVAVNDQVNVDMNAHEDVRA
jgi:hypothetical protein